MAVKSKRVTVFNQANQFFESSEKEQARKNIGVNLVSNGTINIDYVIDEETDEGKFTLDVNERTHFLIGTSSTGNFENLTEVGSKAVKVAVLDVQPEEESDRDVYIVPDPDQPSCGMIGLKNGTYTYSIIFDIKVTDVNPSIQNITIHVGGDSFIAPIDSSFPNTRSIAFSNVVIVQRNETSTLPISVEAPADYTGGILFLLRKVSIHKVGTKIVGSTENVVELVGTEEKTSRKDIPDGVLEVNADNTLTKLTILNDYSGTAFTVNFNSDKDEFIPNFIVEIDNQSNNTIDISVTRNYSETLHYAVVAGNSIDGGKFYQLTCIGSCWTLAQFQ